MSYAPEAAAARGAELQIDNGLDEVLPILQDVVAKAGPLSAFQAVANRQMRYTEARTASGLLASQFSRALRVLQNHGLVEKVTDAQGFRVLALTHRGVALDELLVLIPQAWRQFEAAAAGAQRE